MVEERTTCNEKVIKARKKPAPKSTPKLTTSKEYASSRHGSHVFVRVRPFLSQINKKKNIKDDENQNDNEGEELPLKNLVTETNIMNGGEEGVDALKGSLPISGFNGIFGMNASNDIVFQHSFLPRLDTIMRGGTSSFFCYGYTGAGKTHTTLGYGEEKGVFHEAANEILKRVRLLNDQQLNLKDGRGDEDRTEKKEDSEENEKKKNAHGEEPYMVIASVVEVYNDEVYDLLSEKAKCSLRKNKRGQLLVRGATEKQMFTKEEAEMNGFDFSVITKTLSSIPIHTIDDLNIIQHSANQHRKVGISTEHDQSSRSHAIFRLDIVNQTLLDAMKELEEAEQIKPAIQTAYDKKRSYQLRHRVLEIDEKIDERSQFIDELYLTEGEKKSPFGGRLILVDLAGADSDHRSIGENGQTVAQRKESTAINKSLMALKECISALSSIKPMKSIPFRGSSLTRLLEEVLTPREKRDSDSVMIVNIGPEEDVKSKTVNSLRYGCMFSTLKQKKAKRGTTGVRARSKSQAGKSLMEAKSRMRKEMAKQRECV